MAGLAKPNVQGLGLESKYTFIGGLLNNANQKGVGLFDGTAVNEWDTNKVAYFSGTGNYIEIDIQEDVNIWRSGTTTWSAYIGAFVIKKWNGSAYDDVTNLYAQKVTQINETQWEKTIEKLPKGRYRFERGASSRLDSEWYLERIYKDSKFLISSGDMKSILSARNYKKHTVVNANIESVESSYGYSTSTADKLFDNNISTLWNSYQDDANGKTFVTIKLKEKNVIDSVAFKKISMITSGSYGLKGFKILASNDNINFVELFSGQNPNNDVDSSYSFNNKKAYLYYKFESLDSWHTGKRVILGELEYSLKKDVVEELVSMVNLLEQNFIKHGMNKPLELDLSAEISTRTFIEQSPTTLGGGKVFKKSIDTSQVPIKKVTIK